MTRNKIKNIKENVIIEDSKKELESVIAEFNGAASRNVELLESKITELQELINKANNKMISMDEKIGRMNKPIVIEKIVEKKAPSRKDKQKETAVKKEQPEKEKTEAIAKHSYERGKMLSLNEPEEEVREKPFVTPLNEMTRSEKLKYLIKTGRTKAELMDLGFMENEVNLISFLLKKSG
jgi:hypothetical protein